MDRAQIATLVVIAGVIVALVSERVRSDLAALVGAAVLCTIGVVHLKDLETSFASPAIVALGSLFIIAEGLNSSGLISLLARAAEALLGTFGRWVAPLIIGGCGALSGFINNTPLVVLAAPILEHVGGATGMSSKRLLIPLSYATILGGTCTLIGSSTNLIVDQVVRDAGFRSFRVFEMTGVGLCMAAAGAPYLAFVAPRLLARPALRDSPAEHQIPLQPFRPMAAIIAVITFALAIGGAIGGVPIALAAFVGAVLLIVARVMTTDEAYSALKPNVLVTIAGMLVLGAAIDRTGLADAAATALSSTTASGVPMVALCGVYIATLLLTEFMSHAGAAVLLTPIGISLAQNLDVNPRPFAVGVMMAASASFLTPFGYQTNTIVYDLAGYRYSDFLKVGLPLTILTAAAALIAIPHFFPF